MRGKVQIAATLTPTWSLQIPSFVVSDKLFIRSSSTTLRRQGDDAVTEIRSCLTESEFAPKYTDTAYSSVRPLNTPARVAFTLVVACRGATIIAKLGATTTNTFTGIITEVLVSCIDFRLS
jgi:hypothetical protein